MLGVVWCGFEIQLNMAYHRYDSQTLEIRSQSLADIVSGSPG